VREYLRQSRTYPTDMDQLHATCDKLFTEVDRLERVLDTDDLSEDRIRIALGVAKRVRRESTELVRELARRRDSLGA
jgi:hypothetical protein